MRQRVFAYPSIWGQNAGSTLELARCVTSHREVVVPFAPSAATSPRYAGNATSTNVLKLLEIVGLPIQDVQV